MSLWDLIGDNIGSATLTVATVATDERGNSPSVAKVASVAVASCHADEVEDATPAAHREWRIDGRSATFSPPVSAEQLRRWHPTAALEPVPDARTPPPEATGADGVDRPALVRAVRRALRGTELDVEAVIRELTDDELSDWRLGWLGPAEILAFARSITSRGAP